MRTKFLAFASILALSAMPTHAILGLGGHYVINTGSIESSREEILSQPLVGSFSFDQKSASGLSGFGLKLWIDILPFIDIEATGNMAFTRYKANLIAADSVGGTTEIIPLEVKLSGLPINLPKASPAFSAANADFTITYPFLKFPPAVSIARIYAGAGLTYAASTPVMTPDFAEKVVASANLDPATIATDPDAAEDLTQALADALVDEGLNTGVGGHVVLGSRFKLPIIPIAAYANAKYYFGGGYDKAFKSGAAFELGGGLAF